MNKMPTDNRRERLLQAKQNQPELFAQLPATAKMAVGLYQNSKKPAVRLSADARLRLAGLRQRIAQDNLSPSERTVMALEITNLEKNIGEK